MQKLAKVAIITSIVLLASIFGTIGYLHFYGLSISKLTYSQQISTTSVPNQSVSVNNCSADNAQMLERFSNSSFVWKGNGTINVGQLLQWINATIPYNGIVSTPEYSGAVGSGMLGFLGNQTTFSPKQIQINLQASSTMIQANFQFLGQFHYQNSWGELNTNEIDIHLQYVC